MSTLSDVMAELEAAGTAQTRKVLARHGITPPLFGVNYSVLYPLAKRLKTNHALALALWDTGNYDARILAMMIADPKQADPILLEQWVVNSGNYGLNDAITAYVMRTVYARPKAEAWIPSPDEWLSTAGWGLLCHVSNADKSLPDSYFEAYLSQILTTIHSRPNRTRYAMNNALINIGCRNAVLHERVKEIMPQVGEVYVDHGETGCKTPVVLPYIERVIARKGYAMK